MDIDVTDMTELNLNQTRHRIFGLLSYKFQVSEICNNNFLNSFLIKS